MPASSWLILSRLEGLQASRMLISAIIPTRNRPAMLREAAASVLSQTHKDLELIIVLNGATAENTAAAKEVAAGDERVRLIVLSKGGVAARARNAGIADAKGDWIAFLDDDDVWMPEKLEVQLREALAAGADWVACESVSYDGAPRVSIIPPGLEMKEALMLGCCLPGGPSGAFIRTAVVRSVGGFDESMPMATDWDLWRRLSWNHKVLLVDRVLIKYRVHSGNMGSRGLMRDNFRVMSKMTIDTPPELRHMLVRAWRSFFWNEAANLYERFNRMTGGRARRIYRAIRGFKAAIPLNVILP